MHQNETVCFLSHSSVLSQEEDQDVSTSDLWWSKDKALLFFLFVCFFTDNKIISIVNVKLNR